MLSGLHVAELGQQLRPVAHDVLLVVCLRFDVRKMEQWINRSPIRSQYCTDDWLTDLCTMSAVYLSHLFFIYVYEHTLFDQIRYWEENHKSWAATRVTVAMAEIIRSAPRRAALDIFFLFAPFHHDSPSRFFFCDPVVLESICYRTRANRLINESKTTGGLRKIWTGRLHKSGCLINVLGRFSYFVIVFV